MGFSRGHGFINYQMDAGVMVGVGREMARRFADVEITRVLTAGISGIAPALATGRVLDVSVLCARKTRPVTMTDPVFVEIAPFTRKDIASF